jgi:lipopolysaccharide/colanic/teichoic acid biosynthesis glycosyltransferase
MTYEKDEYGRLLPDEKRLTQYGKFLRSTSLDELPELINIIRGDMSVVGPRPQLVCDMVFMTEQQRMRHIVRPGLTGLAQVNGRNNISWEDKFENDLQYIRQITFIGDMKIIFKTIEIVFKRSNIVRTGTASDINLGDWLLQNGIIEQGEYEEKHNEAKELMKV